MEKRQTAMRIHRLNLVFCFVLTAFSMAMVFTPSPLAPDVSDLDWNSIGCVLTIIFALVYMLNAVVGPDFGDEE